MFLCRKNYLSVYQLRFLSTQVREIPAIDGTWNSAKPYQSISGPSTFNLIRSYQPGGQFSDLNYPEVHKILRNTFGPIYKIKGIFGKSDLIIVDDPKDFEVVFRTMGVHPLRRGFDSILHYRKVERKDSSQYSKSLFIEQGQAWWDLRQKINGILFKPEVVSGYVEPIDKMTQDFIEKLHNLRDTNLETPANLYFELTKWALEAIVFVAMNLRLGLLSTEPDGRVRQLLNCTQAISSLTYELDFQPSLWKIYKTAKYRKFAKTVEQCDEILAELHKEGLRNLQDLEGKGQNTENCVFQKLNNIDENIATVLTFDMILAGVDTVSSVAISIFYNLAKNPDKQTILREELLKVLPEKDSPLTAEKMKNLPYLRACIKETLRLMPIVNGLSRGTGQDIVLSGYQIPKDTNVFMPNNPCHMNDQLFPHAESFLPERWLRSQVKQEKYKPFTYLPFGFGSRACVGRRFADLEMETLIARLVRNYHLEWHHPPPKIHSRAVNIPYGNLKLRMKEIS